MTGQEISFHVSSPSGVLLTRYWGGHYESGFKPLTHVMMAGRAPGGVVLLRNASADSWNLPGGGRRPHEQSQPCAKRMFEQETGLVPRDASILGYFRIMTGSRIEYGALVFCRCENPGRQGRAAKNRQMRLWDCASPLAGMDPIAATLAVTASKTIPWRLASVQRP